MERRTAGAAGGGESLAAARCAVRAELRGLRRGRLLRQLRDVAGASAEREVALAVLAILEEANVGVGGSASGMTWDHFWNRVPPHPMISMPTLP